MPKKIAVIGGGFSGTMVIRQLIDLGFKGEITRYHAPDSETCGPAYHTENSELLLNVRSENMSAFPDKPNDFVAFLQKEFPGVSDPENFVPRSIYGSYLKHLWKETILLAREKNISLQLNQAYLPDLSMIDGVVLATGNEIPRFPKELDLDLKSSSYYQGNPWNIDFHSISRKLPLFILGNGLTMVDTVLRLRHLGFEQKITALSSHGFQMLAHPSSKKINFDHAKPTNTDLVSLLHFFNLKRKALSLGEFMALIDSLRPNFTQWWKGFSLLEKKMFVQRLRHFWGTVRHRIPAEIEKKIKEERISGGLEVCAGKLISVELKNEGLSIRYLTSEQEQEGDFACLINCTGPETSLTKVNNPVLQSFLNKDWIQADELDLGLKIKPENHLAIGQAPIPIYAIGNLCRGSLWESTAIGELRSQAKLIAKGIIDMK